MPNTKTVECPNCGAAVAWSAGSKFKPFCSERCRMIDFGDWANEKHTIPGESVMDESLEDLTGSNTFEK